MDNKDNETIIGPGPVVREPEQEEVLVAAKPKTGGRRFFVPIGAVLTLVGWLLMMVNPYISAACTFVGLVLSIIGVRIPPGPRRDIAITSIIASSVLLIVLGAFFCLLSMI